FGRVDDGGKEFISSGTAYQRYVDLSRTTQTMELLVPYTDRRFAVGMGEDARELHIGATGADFWRLFTARPVIGRFFTADDDTPSAPRVVVLSYDYWQSEYAGSREVLGKTVTIGPLLYTVIGVSPPGFAGAEPVAPSAFIPISSAAVATFSAQGWDKYRTAYN